MIVLLLQLFKIVCRRDIQSMMTNIQKEFIDKPAV